MDQENKFVEILRKRKLKATSIRLKVLSILSDQGKAITLAKIQEGLKDFDRVTLYRTINALEDSGIIHKALQEGNDTFYALCNHSSCSSEHHDHNHIHFKCNECNDVSCVKVSTPVAFELPGYSVQNFEIQATGLCEACLS